MAKRVSSPNYSTLIKELKSSSSILDKTKSKNIKTYMRSMKTFEKSPTNISTFNKASETKGLLKERKRNEYNLDGKIDIKISLNYNKETEEGINEAKFSRVQPKEKLITSLKTSSHLRKKTISDPFSSKPLLNSSNIHKRYSSEINNNVSISLVNYHNSNMCKYPSNSSSFITKNHQQSKTVMKRNESISNTITMNDFTLNKSGAIHKDLGTCMMSPTNKKLELRLNDMLKGVYDSESLKDGYNITKKKLNVYRKIFSEYISTCTEGRDFLMMVYDGLSYSIEEMLLYNKSLQGKIKENLSIGASKEVTLLSF